MIEEKLLEYKGATYIVSSNGKIYSTKNCGRGKYHQEIVQRKNDDGYLCVTVGTNENRTVTRVHRLVALAFIENPDGLPEVDHIDNNKENNDVTNLQWISGTRNKQKIPFETRSASHKHGLNGRAILNEDDVKEIRRLFRNGVSQSEIAKRYNRGWSTIHNIVTEQTWKGIENTSTKEV